MIKTLNKNKQQIGYAAGTYTAAVPPDEIGAAADLAFWFRADQELYTDSAGTTAASSGDTIGRWGDLSGNGRHLKASAANREPTLGARTGAGGGPGVDFDGSANALVTDAFTAITNPIHVFLVLYKEVYGNNDYIYSNVADTDFSLLQQTTDATLKLYSQGGSAVSSTDGAMTQWLWIEALHNNTSSSLIIDGNAAVTGTTGADSLTQLCLGAANETTGHSDIIVSEFFGYSSEITDTAGDLTAIRDYVSRRYGVSTL